MRLIIDRLEANGWVPHVWYFYWYDLRIALAVLKNLRNHEFLGVQYRLRLGRKP